MTLNSLRFFVSVIGSLALLAPAGTHAQAEVPLLHATGNAEVKVVPDHVVIAFGVETFAKELADAKRENDGRVSGVIASAKAHKVAAKDIQTDYVSVEPTYENHNVSRTLTGYIVRKTVVATIREVPRFEEILGAALGAGANHVHGIEFKTSELRKHRDAARALALKAAREKADAMAATLGQAVGDPYTITEQQEWWGSGYGSGWGGGGFRGMMMAQNVSEGAPGGGTGGESSFSPGEISVRAAVQVSFRFKAAGVPAP